MIDIPVQILASRSEGERYIEDCIVSLRQQRGLGHLFALHVFVGLYQPVEPSLVENVKAMAGEGLSITFVSIDKDCGYGEKQNYIWRECVSQRWPKAETFLMLNPDMILLDDVVPTLLAAYERNGGDAYIVEARQFPIENPARAFDRETEEVDWCSGACIMVSSRFFEASGGFDESIYLYCEDVDLSWRAWLAGGKALYCYNAVVAHMTNGIFNGGRNRFSVTNHEYHMALSQLILTFKYFSSDESLYSAKMALFWSNGWIAPRSKDQAFAKFESIRDSLTIFDQSHPRIKIIDVGLYSSMRSNLI